ncbi:PTS system mannose/fructose/N-acetylgalactosamine-transporter subunit IIB [Maledivibacter halophilus]|uniref:PTS system, mannose-specific IIB component n=1 Tax=Maledivibacter halophilus TaxID=36842 RepID=A0A1T5MCQ8_9FIRM|nr:PTS sugar transporter subunit IIB [Maledivibacter halophilus]SKC85764.1 PTS system, mannose-specific IIB component [Maledivibacter halophilus]
MENNFIRIDDRLIHGQIIARWSRHLSLKNIIAVDDKTASNPMLKSIMMMSVPKQYKTYICKMEEFKDLINGLEKDNGNNLIIARFPYMLKNILSEDMKAKSINIGNVSKKDEDSFEIMSNIFLTKEDVSVIEELHNQGKEIVFQLVPDSQRLSWDKIRNKYIG